MGSSQYDGGMKLRQENFLCVMFLKWRRWGRAGGGGKIGY